MIGETMILTEHLLLVILLSLSFFLVLLVAMTVDSIPLFAPEHPADAHDLQ